VDAKQIPLFLCYAHLDISFFIDQILSRVPLRPSINIMQNF
jgi:hypothetical protein